MLRRPGGWVLLACLAACAPPAAADEARVLRDLAYRGEAGPPTLDLHLPDADAPAPLLVFVHSRFWKEARGGRVLTAGFVRPLRAAGVAVAVVRHRPAPEHRHPDPVRDVAAALRFLLDRADEYGLDRERVTLAGHSSGAHLAALLALDPRWLGEVDLAPADLAGVVGLSGIYDLDPEERSEEERAWFEQAFGADRRDASPLALVRPDAPRFLVLSAQDDIPGYIRDADRFASVLRDAGHPDAESYVVMGRNHGSIVDLATREQGTRMYLFDFLGLEPLTGEVAELRDALRHWRRPERSTEPFFTSGAPVRALPADERFVATVRAFFVGLVHKRVVWSAKSYDAVALEALLEALGSERAGRGDWLTLTNVQGEQLHFRLDELLRHDPVVVIGIDARRNLFRTVDLDRALREYSWRDGPPPPFAVRPLGAFLYLRAPRDGFALPSGRRHFGLELGGFARSESDPLARLSAAPPLAASALRSEPGCAGCHAVLGEGPRAGHLRAVDGELMGGFALPLEEYPPEVISRYLETPSAAAALVGRPLHPLDGLPARQLLEWLEERR